MGAELDRWFSDLSPEQRRIAICLRNIVLTWAPHLREDLKWGRPCYTGNALVCYLQATRGHVSLGFGRGAALCDPASVLSGGGLQMRHVKIPLGATPDDTALSDLIRHAVALDSDG